MASVFIRMEGPAADSQKIFTGCYVVFVGSVGAGVSISQMPSISKAKAAALKIF